MADRIPDLDSLPRGLRSLRAFQKAHPRAVLACEAVERLRGGERSGFARQVRNAAGSLYANIAEGHAKPTRAEQARYYDRAIASLAELQAHFVHGVARRMLAPAVTAPLHVRAAYQPAAHRAA